MEIKHLSNYEKTTLLVCELSSTRNAFKGLVTSILHEAVEHFQLL